MADMQQIQTAYSEAQQQVLIRALSDTHRYSTIQLHPAIYFCITWSRDAQRFSPEHHRNGRRTAVRPTVVCTTSSLFACMVCEWCNVTSHEFLIEPDVILTYCCYETIDRKCSADSMKCFRQCAPWDTCESPISPALSPMERADTTTFRLRLIFVESSHWVYQMSDGKHRSKFE